MELLLLLISASCLLVGVVGNHPAPLPSEIYWKNKLPNTPMPTILHELLHPDQQGKLLTDRAGSLRPSDNLYDVKYSSKDNSLTDNTGSLRVSDNLYDVKYSKHKSLTDKAGSLRPSDNLYDVKYKSKDKSLTDNIGSLRISKDLYGVKYNSKHESLTDKAGSLRPSDNLYDVKYRSKDNSLTDKAGSLRPSDNLYDVKYNQKDKSVTDRIGTLDNLYNVKYMPPINKSTIPNGENLNAAVNSPGASRFFLEKDLYPGAKMNLHFVVSTASGTTFLPQKLAKVTPFSSSKLPEILNQFNINPKSQKAEFISQIIMVCEKPAMENEEKYCATSLESLVKYGTSKFGKNVNVFTTVIGGDKGKRTRAGKQQYVVGSGIRKIVSDNLVVCHSLPYPYAVFFCHATAAHTAQASVVPLVGEDGTKIKATAVCHKDTSKWDPDHVAFQVLKVKPGTVPVCHFLTEDTIVWAGKKK